MSLDKPDPNDEVDTHDSQTRNLFMSDEAPELPIQPEALGEDEKARPQPADELPSALESDDLIDMIHSHPFLADGGPEIQFNMIFPRARNYRVWVQFQRNGVVNTAHFDVPVKELE